MQALRIRTLDSTAISGTLLFKSASSTCVLFIIKIIFLILKFKVFPRKDVLFPITLEVKINLKLKGLNSIKANWYALNRDFMSSFLVLQNIIMILIGPTNQLLVFLLLFLNTQD